MTARGKIWVGVAALALFVVGANAHPVYVAVTSQPECVAHHKLGAAADGSFSAAKSACSSETE